MKNRYIARLIGKNYNVWNYVLCTATANFVIREEFSGERKKTTETSVIVQLNLE